MQKNLNSLGAYSAEISYQLSKMELEVKVYFIAHCSREKSVKILPMIRKIKHYGRKEKFNKKNYSDHLRWEHAACLCVARCLLNFKAFLHDLC